MTSTNRTWEEEFDKEFEVYEFESLHNAPQIVVAFRSEPSPTDIKSFISSELQRERREMIEQLEKIEKEQWSDAIHCTCLGYAIDQLKSNKQ